MMMEDYENPWDIKSVFELLVFKCPVCEYLSPNKQKFVNHACYSHPGSIPYLLSVDDGSLADVHIPTKTKLDPDGEYGDDYEDDGGNFLLDDFEFSMTEGDESKADVKKHKTPRRKRTSYAQSVSSNKLSCKECNESFKTYHGLSEHVYSAHVIGPVAPDDDDVAHEQHDNGEMKEATFGDEQDHEIPPPEVKMEHPVVKMEVSDDPMTCEKCHEVFPNSKELSAHSNSSHSSKCAICLNVLVPAETMIKHMAESHKRVEFGCVNCEIFCETEKVLLEHLKRCGNSILCPICTTACDSYRELKKHVKEAHWKAGPKEPLTCHICGMTKNTQTAMSLHMETAHSNITWTCDECGKNFLSERYLKVHKQSIHAGKKNYQCEHCGREFFKITDWRTHVQNKHLGQRNHQCPNCGKCCSTKSGLKKHIDRAHNEVKKYQCDKCDRSFATKQELGHHILNIHQGLKPFKCADCGKDFSRKDNHDAHVRIVHRGIKGYRCEKCGKDFVRKKFLEEHTCQPILISPIN